jgi:alpha-beta hydrolase superfamily lysophospholipase
MLRVEVVVDEDSTAVGISMIAVPTPAGETRGRLHWCSGGTAILWVFGAGGGLGGPSGGVYHRLAETLRAEGVASLELDYRRPGDLRECVADVLSGIAWLEARGKSQIVLVGHSFGGAVVISTAAIAPQVIAVAALSSQTVGTANVGALAGRPLLLVHGEADEILPSRCSRDIFERAGEPKQLILYPGCRHGLDECRDELDRDLLAWLHLLETT